MSTPSAPYYYKEGSDTCHWETSCSKNNYPAQDRKLSLVIQTQE